MNQYDIEVRRGEELQDQYYKRMIGAEAAFGMATVVIWTILLAIAALALVWVVGQQIDRIEFCKSALKIGIDNFYWQGCQPYEIFMP